MENKMNSRDFVYWLQGFFEITDAKKITPSQLEIIKKHLDAVFVHDKNIHKDWIAPTQQAQLSTIFPDLGVKVC